MGGPGHLHIDEAFERIEEVILPGMSLMLDTLLDAAGLARPGLDAEVYAAELRTVALQLEELMRQVEALAPAVDQAPLPARICA